MGFHIRQSSKVTERRKQNRRRVIITSIIVDAIVCVVVLAGLICKKIFQEAPAQGQFIAHTVPQEETPPPAPKPPKSKPSGGSSRIVTPVIVTNVSTATNIGPISVDFGPGLGGIGGGTGSSFGPGDIGDGGGDEGPGEMGYNDDIQVCFVLDASGSMNELFNTLSGTLFYFYTALLESTIDGAPVRVQMSYVIYGHERSAGTPYMAYDFNQNLLEMGYSLATQGCAGSYEPQGEAVRFAVEKLGWNRRSSQPIYRTIVICGNEDMEEGSVTWRNAADSARKEGIIVNTVYCDSGKPAAGWEGLAQAGKGESLQYEMSDGGSIKLPKAAVDMLVKVDDARKFIDMRKEELLKSSRGMPDGIRSRFDKLNNERKSMETRIASNKLKSAELDRAKRNLAVTLRAMDELTADYVAKDAKVKEYNEQIKELRGTLRAMPLPSNKAMEALTADQRRFASQLMDVFCRQAKTKGIDVKR